MLPDAVGWWLVVGGWGWQEFLHVEHAASAGGREELLGESLVGSNCIVWETQISLFSSEGLFSPLLSCPMP